MSKFQKVIEKALKRSSEILEEMPAAVKSEDFDLSGMFNKIKKELNEVEKFETFKLLRSDKGEYVHDFLVDGKGKPVLYSSYKISEGFGLFAKSIFQNTDVKGLARRYYVHYLLPKYGRIMSDEDLTKDGLEFYVKMFDTVNISVIDTQTKQKGRLDSAEEMYDYYGVGLGRFRFMLTPKQ